jgi:hypothetical protein
MAGYSEVTVVNRDFTQHRWHDGIPLIFEAGFPFLPSL